MEHKKSIKEKEFDNLQKTLQNKLREKEDEIHALQQELAGLEKEMKAAAEEAGKEVVDGKEQKNNG